MNDTEAKRPNPRPSAERAGSVLELVRRVRHDASGPLTVALGHLQLLLEDPERLDDGMEQSLRVVESELLRLIDVLRRLDAIPSIPRSKS